MDKVIIGLVSAILAFVAGLLVPWVKWEIEKCRLQRDKREQLIEKWKKIDSSENFSAKSFLQSREYSELRVHIPEEVSSSFESKYEIISLDSSRPDTFQNKLLDEISKLEKKWGLV